MVIKHIESGKIFRCFKSNLDAKKGCMLDNDLDKNVDYCDDQFNTHDIINNCYIMNERGISTNNGLKLGNDYKLRRLFLYAILIFPFIIGFSILLLLFITIITPEDQMYYYLSQTKVYEWIDECI